MADVYSYSKVSLFDQCALRYRYHYIDKIEVEDDPQEDSPLLLGSTMDKGLEHGFQAAEDYYNSVFPYNTQKKEYELAKIKYWVDKIRPHLVGGQFQIELKTDSFVGYADWYGNNTLVDMKYGNPKSADKYRDSAQLHLYYNIMTKMGYEIDDMLYLVIPKVYIRQKKGESTKMFYNRLNETLDSLEPIQIHVDFDERKLVQFGKSIENITIANVDNHFPANPSKLCDFCEYKNICDNKL